MNQANPGPTMVNQTKEISSKEILSNKSSAKREIFVSVVVPVRHWPGKPALIELQQSLETAFADYEILLIAGRSAQAELNAHSVELLAQVPCIRYLQLSGNVAPDTMRTAGIENAIGDFVVILDLTKDPAALAVEAVNEALNQGKDLMIGLGDEQQSILRRLLAWPLKPLLKMASYDLPKISTSLFCLSRRAVNTVMSISNAGQLFLVRLKESGYEIGTLHYHEKQGFERRLGGSLAGLWRLVVFNSLTPLRTVSLLGFASSGIAFLFALYSLLVKLFMDGVIEGWTSTFLLMTLFFMIEFIILAVVTEYLGRILEEQRPQPYAVVFEKTSARMVNADRINVLKESVD